MKQKQKLFMVIGVLVLIVAVVLLKPLLPSSPAHNRTVIDRGEDYDPEQPYIDIFMETTATNYQDLTHS